MVFNFYCFLKPAFLYVTQILAAPGFSFWKHKIKNVSVWISGKDRKTPVWTTNPTISRLEALRVRHKAGRLFGIVASSKVKP